MSRRISRNKSVCVWSADAFVHFHLVKSVLGQFQTLRWTSGPYLWLNLAWVQAGSWYLGSAARPLFHQLCLQMTTAVQPANTRPQNNLALFPYRRWKWGHVVQLDCGGGEIRRGDAECCSFVALRAETWNSCLNVKIYFDALSILNFLFK